MVDLLINRPIFVSFLDIISLGRGKINYRAGAEGMVSFKINSPIRIKSKSAGTDLSLWGIEVNGREGYAPKTLIREEKIVVPDKDLKYIVDVVDPSISPPVVEPTVLNSSSESIVEATSTKPLEAVSTDSQGEAIVKSPGENAGNVSPQTATPVQEDTIVVDGTRLPALHEPSDTVAASKDNEEQLQQASSTSTMSADSDDDGGDDEDDGDIGDYDDDEDEENSEEVVSTKMMQMESVSLNVSTDNNLDKSQETSEDVMKNDVAEEKENIVVEDVKNDTIDVAVEATTPSPVVIENDSSEGAVEIIDSVTESLPLPEETTTVTSIPESTITHNSSDTLAPEGVEQPHDDHQQQVPKDDEKTENSVIDNTVVNTINEVASPTANEEGHLVDNNISNEPSLPDNNIHDGLITDTLLPIANSSETHESVQVEIPVSDNIELLEPNNTVQSDSPTVTSDLPIVNHASQSHETEQPSYQNSYLDPTQTEGVQINSETIQTSVQTESPVLNSETQTEAPHHHNDPYHHNTNDHVEPSRFNPYDNVESSNTPLPPQYDFNNPTESSITDTPPHNDYYGQPPAGYLPTETVQEDTTLKPPYIATTDVPIVSQPEPATDVPQGQIPDSPYREEISYGQGIVEPLQPLVTPEPPTPKEDDEPKTLPSLTPSLSVEEVEKKDKGLFATIMDTVNNILPNNKKVKLQSHEIDDTDELNKILYPGQHSHLGHHATKEGKLFILYIHTIISKSSFIATSIGGQDNSPKD